MSKINSYSVVAVPKLTDKLVGTSIDGVPADVTYNFTLQQLLNLFSANFSASTIVIGSVPIYADNAAAVAGGLAVGKLYRTGDTLKIVHV
jgi:hypothetical protein